MTDQAPGGAERPAEDSGLPGCYRHPDRETGVRCVRCDRPICPECMISASVGFQCPECVRGGSGTGPAPGAAAPRTLAGGVMSEDPRLITKIILGLNLAVFLAVLTGGDRVSDPMLLVGKAIFSFGGPLEGVAEGQYYRLLSSVFLHEEVAHIALNMLALWFLGPPLEAALGRLRFVTLYVLSGLGGSALFYLVAAPNDAALGASGAIFGLFGATAVLMRRMNYDMRPVLVLLAINLVFTFTWSGIAWQGHIGGLVIGTAVAYGFVHAPRDKRVLVQRAVAAAALLAIVAVVVIRTLQLT
ncbi:rhomboid family intramembrane serine protease [Streptomyces sp. NBC_01808]|uniref:rhomboid family intramembrane serine protease n=1 Tax=Streptomyces sp. NBC_01808 TaxID=2975947 RepID=UPI002DDC3AB7|nr:rhomboid family intramembrane serine protease [Streptomyces sp. NBC_01808]WSA39074.1 rhomboid family intramembrane serine protease [Streptomyces sp. NBC_01808]